MQLRITAIRGGIAKNYVKTNRILYLHCLWVRSFLLVKGTVTALNRALHFLEKEMGFLNIPKNDSHHVSFVH